MLMRIRNCGSGRFLDEYRPLTLACSLFWSQTFLKNVSPFFEMRPEVISRSEGLGLLTRSPV